MNPFLLEIDAVRNNTIGVARPRAQGHAITKIAIVELIVPEKSLPRIKNLVKKFIKLKSKIEGTKIYVILFTSSWTLGFVVCAFKINFSI